MVAHLAVLKKDLPSPFLRESDEEKGGREEGRQPRIAAAARTTTSPRRTSRRQGKRKGEKEKPFTIDFEGIDQRILSFPLPTGNYGGLTGRGGGPGLLPRPAGGRRGGGRGGGPRGGAAAPLRPRTPARHRRAAGVIAYELTPDGRKMLYSTGGDNWFIGSTSGGGGGGAAPAPMAAGGGRGRRPGGAPRRGPVVAGDGRRRQAQPRRHRGPRRSAGRVEADLRGGVADQPRLLLRPQHARRRLAGDEEEVRAVPAARDQQRRPVPRHRLDALRTGRRATAVHARRAASTTARPSPAGCSAPTTRSPTAATASRRSTAG